MFMYAYMYTVNFNIMYIFIIDCLYSDSSVTLQKEINKIVCIIYDFI